jgi:hypothetical protein
MVDSGCAVVEDHVVTYLARVVLVAAVSGIRVSGLLFSEK